MSLDWRGDTAAAAVTVASPPANLRAVVRVGSEFLLRSVDNMVSAQDGNLIETLIFSLIWMNNVRHITQSSANAEYGAPGDLPPDSMRQPVDVKSVAQQLGLPYETVRRYAQALIAAGDCVRVGKRGLIAPSAVLAHPRRLQSFQDSLPSLLRLLSDLKRAGFDFAPYRLPHAGTVPLSGPGELPRNARAMLRLGMNAVVRSLTTTAQLHDGDYLMGLIYSSIWVANVHHITVGNDNARFAAIDETPPDEERRPVTVNAVAAALKLPYETTRRYVNRLVERGHATRLDGRGVIVPRDRMMQPDHLQAAVSTYQDITSIVADFYRAGFDFSGY